MTWQIKELEILIGKASTRKLILMANQKYLRRVSIPNKPTPELVDNVGADAALKLSHEYGGTYIHVSKCYSQFLRFRNVQMLAELKYGVPVKTLSERYGLTSSAISRIKIMSNSNSRFLVFRNAQIFAERRSGVTLRELSERYDLSMSAISKILKKYAKDILLNKEKV